MKAFLNQRLVGFIAAVILYSIAGFGATPNPEAPQAGNFNYNIVSEPATLHPIRSSDHHATLVHEFVCDYLIWRDANTYEWQPRIAEKWEISKDRKVFTFYINKKAKFHDGKAVTAEDVKFSFDAIFAPEFEAFNLQPYYDGISKVETVDEHTVKVTAKDNYFKNFDAIAGLTIIPKHIYSDFAKSKDMNKTVICSGPYAIEKYTTGQSIIAKKVDHWYGHEYAYLKGAYNFKTVTFRFYKDENIALERLKRGDIDYHWNMLPDSFGPKTQGDPWGKTAFAVAAENLSPKRLVWVGWNFKRPIFQSRNVRMALTYLSNREEMNKKFNNNLQDIAAAPIYPGSPYFPEGLKPLPFSIDKARELLAQDGWKDADKNGVLEKKIGGKTVELKFKLHYAAKDRQKYWEFYQQDLKQAGIQMELAYLEWNSFTELFKNGDFDAIAMAWAGGDLDPDPKQIWHSTSARAGGSNFIAYKNAKVDAAIDKARFEFDRAKRIKLLQGVYKMIAEDYPYVFLFHTKYEFYGASNKVERLGDSFKYEVAPYYWYATSK